MRSRPTAVIWAGGSKEIGVGGSGARLLINHSLGRVEKPEFDVTVVGLVSHYATGSVQHMAEEEFRIPFYHFNRHHGKDLGVYCEEIANRFKADFHFLSGFPLLVGVKDLTAAPDTSFGLDPRYTANIHPALLYDNDRSLGGPGMYDMHVHREVFRRKQAKLPGSDVSGCSVHFATKKYDDGPVTERVPISIANARSPEEIKTLVNKGTEHPNQPRMFNDIAHGFVFWDGIDPASLQRAR